MGDIEFQHLIEFTGSDELGDDEDAGPGRRSSRTRGGDHRHGHHDVQSRNHRPRAQLREVQGDRERG